MGLSAIFTERRIIYMQVILTEDVRSLGKKGDIVNVNDGYARNYLLPKKLGLIADAKNVNELKQRQASEERAAKLRLQEAKDLAAKIEAGHITVAVKFGEGGRAFGSVSSKEIAAAAKEQMGLDIDRKKIQLAEPIKTAGEHTVTLRLHADVTARLKLNVAEA